MSMSTENHRRFACNTKLLQYITEPCADYICGYYLNCIFVLDHKVKLVVCQIIPRVNLCNIG